MIRLSLLLAVVAALLVYAWKDWYKSLCGLVVLTSILNHPDVPRALFGIPGLSPFNILLVNNLLACMVQRGSGRPHFNFLPHVGLLLGAYALVFVVAFLRAVLDRTNIEHISPQDMWIDMFFNTVKWTIPGLLLFGGARTPERLKWGLYATLLFYLLLALQVVKAMPLGALVSGHELQRLALRIIPMQTSYSRVNMSMMLGGGAWAILAAQSLSRRKPWRLACLGAFVATTYGQALTGGRTGYATWAVIGLVLSALRWRRYLLLAPVVAVAVALALPATVERLTTGFTAAGDEDGALSMEGGERDDSAITSGRNVVWPFIIEKVKSSPFIGYGMLAMMRTGLSAEFPDFPHPHNAYLEILLDGGLLSLIPVALFHLVVLFHAARLLLRPLRPEDVALGGAAIALTLALLIAAVGSQHFYPQMGSIGMWASIGLMLRASTDRRQLLRRRRRASLAQRLDPIPRPLPRSVPGRAT